MYGFMNELDSFLDFMSVVLWILFIIDFIIFWVMSEYNSLVRLLIFRVIFCLIVFLLIKFNFPEISSIIGVWFWIVLCIINLLLFIRCFFQNKKRELEKKKTITVNKISPKKELAMYERMFKGGVISKSIYEKKRNAILETQRTSLESLEKNLHQNGK